MASDRPKPPPGVLFHFDATDPTTYELDERGRVRAILGPDGKPVMVQDDPEKRPRLVKVGWCSAMRRRAMASKAVCWKWEEERTLQPRTGAFGERLIGGGSEMVTRSGPVPKHGHTKGQRIESYNARLLPQPYICARCGVVFAEEESDANDT